MTTDEKLRAQMGAILDEARRDVAERAHGKPLLAPDDPRVAANRAALEAALPSVEEIIDAALDDQVDPNKPTGGVHPRGIA